MMKRSGDLHLLPRFYQVNDMAYYLFARWHLFQHVGYLRHQQQVDLLTLKVVSESRNVGYLCAHFGLPRPLCSRLRPDVRERQTDRQTSDKSIA